MAGRDRAIVEYCGLLKVVGRLIADGEAVVFWEMDTKRGPLRGCDHIRVQEDGSLQVTTYCSRCFQDKRACH